MRKREIQSGFIQAINRLNDQSGSVLASVLLILIILLGIFLSAMTYALSRYGVHQKSQNDLISKHLAEAGITHQLSQIETAGIELGGVYKEAPNGGTIVTELHGWGPNLLIISKGKYRSSITQVTALIGSAAPEYLDAAITVCDESMPLVVASHTKIIGDVNSGPMGIIKGRFRGAGVVDDNYLTGTNRIHASLSVPKLDTSVTALYKHELDSRRRTVSTELAGSAIFKSSDSEQLKSYNQVHIENDLVMDNVFLKEFQMVKSFFVDGSVEIRGNTVISGLIEIISGRDIVVRDSAIVDHAILKADGSITFRDYCTFSGTALSDGLISVKDNAELIHPSFLISEKRESHYNPQSGIRLTSRSNLETFCYLEIGEDQLSNTDRLIYLDDQTLLTGVMISQGYSDLRGFLLGSIITDKFHFEYSPTTYLNWLKGAYVNRKSLSYVPAIPVIQPLDSSLRLSIIRRD